MGRPREVGLRYFPFCVNLDVEVESVCAVFGNDALAVWLTILRECYRTGMSRLIVTPRITALLAQRSRVSVEQFGVIVRAFAEESVFDLSLLEHGIISSHGVQRQLGKVEQERDYWRDQKQLKQPGNELLERKHRESNNYPPYSPTNEIEIEIEKEIETEKERETGMGSRSAPATNTFPESEESFQLEAPPIKGAKPRPKFQPPSEQECINYFQENGMYGGAEQGKQFWLHFENCDWKLSSGRGARMRDWRLAAQRWANNAPNYSRTNGNGTYQSNGKTAYQKRGEFNINNHTAGFDQLERDFEAIDAVFGRNSSQ